MIKLLQICNSIYFFKNISIEIWDPLMDLFYRLWYLGDYWGHSASRFIFFKSWHKEFTNGSCICRSSRSFGEVLGSFSLISIKVCLRFFEGWNIPQMGLSKARLFRKGTYGGGHVEFPKDLTRFWSGRVWNPRSSTIFVNSSMVSGGCSLAYLWRSNLVYGSAISTRSLWRLELFLKNGSLNVYYFD